MGDDGNYVVLGTIAGVYGVQGWVKVFSFTAPRENILKYRPWFLKIGGQWQACKVLAGKAHGKAVIAHLEGCDDRDAAKRLFDVEIAVPRAKLPPLPEGEFYWADLIGLDVINDEGVPLGVVSHFFETGANDVMVVEGERQRLIPYVMEQVITKVDLDKRCITVHWHPDD